MARRQLELFDEPVMLLRPPSLPAGAHWHELNLAAGRLGFMLRRSRRRTIGLVVRDDGLMVQAPRWSTVGQIESAVRGKSDWILRKLGERVRHLELLALQKTRWRQGGTVPYLGTPLVLQLDGGVPTQFCGDPRSPRPRDVLRLALPASADGERVREAASLWFRQQAQAHFEARLAHFVALAGARMQGWGLSSAGSRWGSCSGAGRILLNWRLIHFKPQLIDYVVAHEVAHLRVMNHGPGFWALVAQLYPPWQEARTALARHRPGILPLD